MNEGGALESLPRGRTDKKVNEVLVPGGYVNTWCRSNRAAETLERP